MNRPAAGVNLWYKLGGDSGFCNNGENPQLKVAVLCPGANYHTTGKLTKNLVNIGTFIQVRD